MMAAAFRFEFERRNVMWRIGRLFLMASMGGMMFATACLPDNFLANKWGEIVNTTIMTIYNDLILDQIIGIIPV
jgi:hypothetical protein